MSTESWILFIGFTLIIWGFGHISSQISKQTEAITDGIRSIRSLKDVLEKEDVRNWGDPIYNIDDIHKSISDLPEAIGGEIRWVFGFSKNSHEDLDYALKDIRGTLDNINQKLLDIEIKID